MKLKFFILIEIICLQLFLYSCNHNRPSTVPPKQYTGKQAQLPKELPMDFDKPWHQNRAKHKVSANQSQSFKKKFSEESEIAIMLESEPLKLVKKTTLTKTIKDSKVTPSEKKPNSHSSNKYRIQLLTVADIETAQEKKRKFSYLIGTNVEIVFDAPFYKLRFGHFKSKRKAENKILDIEDLGLQGFIIKEK